ncbi:MAG: NAD(+) synthase, partial [Actinomycetota bacterium]
TTGNKSETSVGFCTLYGDMAGGFAMLKDVPKTMVYELCRYRNSLGGEVIPASIIEREPSAELAPGQKDSDSLPPYDVLDKIIEDYVEYDRSLRDIVSAGIDEETVRRITRMIDRNEYKRRQAPPGIKITSRAFGKDRRFPITNRFGA